MSTNTEAPPHWWQTAVIYQIYPRSFQDTNNDGVGDIRGIVDRLDHLVELGADAVWLSPIFPSPMADFGYDVSDYTGMQTISGRSSEKTISSATNPAVRLKG